MECWDKSTKCGMLYDSHQTLIHILMCANWKIIIEATNFFKTTLSKYFQFFSFGLFLSQHMIQSSNIQLKSQFNFTIVTKHGKLKDGKCIHKAKRHHHILKMAIVYEMQSSICHLFKYTPSCMHHTSRS